MKTRKLIGKVTEQERDEIRGLYERRNALAELFKTVDADNHGLYEQIVADMARTVAAFQRWWDEKSRQYQWENIPGHRWEVDFGTGDIYLVSDREQ